MSWVSSTCVVTVEEGAHAKVQQELAATGIDWRMWWGIGAHREKAAAHHPRGPLPATENLAKSTLGLPFYRDLTELDVDHIVATMSPGRLR